MISFTRPFQHWIPSPFPGHIYQRFFYIVAPYYSDNDIRRSGEVYYEIFRRGRSRNDNIILDKVNLYLRLKTNEDFSGTFMILAEWRDVHPYPHGSCSLCYFIRRYPSLRAILNQVCIALHICSVYICIDLEL